MRTLTIADGQTASPVLDLTDYNQIVTRTLNFYIPDHGVTVNVQLALSTTGTFYAVNDGYGNDYALQPTKFQFLTNVRAGALKLVATSAVSGDQVFGIEW